MTTKQIIIKDLNILNAGALLQKDSIPYLEQLRVKEYSERIDPVPGIRRAFIPWSGGLDSTSCLFMALESGIDVTTVSFNYGQEYWNKESASTRQIRDKLKNSCTNWIMHIEIDINYLVEELHKMFSGNWGHIFPLRNYIILKMISDLEYIKPYDEIWFGVVQGEIPYSGGDKSSIFLSYMKKFMGDRELQLVLPLIGLNKSDLLHWSLRKEVRYNTLVETVSCFSGNGGTHCGKCQSCFNRAVAFFGVNKLKDCGFKFEESDLLDFAERYKTKLQKEDYYSPSRKSDIINFINYLSNDHRNNSKLQ